MNERERAEEEWTGKAAAIVASMSQVLAARGWNVVIISIARRVQVSPGEVISPGSTILLVEPGMEPALPAEARNLRNMADQLDRMFRESGAQEAERGYSEELIGPWNTPSPRKAGL